MSNKIILNQRIVYDKNTASLSDVDSPGDVIVLTTPANNCLQILLNNRWEITTQKELFAEVWEKHGIPINANTLYQNIAMIRKAFRQLGVEDDIIVTVPRRGMLVAENVRIDDFVAEELPATVQIDAPERASVAMELGQQESTLMPAAEIPRRNAKKILMQAVVYLLLMALTAVAASFLYRAYMNTQSRFYSYNYLGDYQQCRMYADSKSENNARRAAEEQIARAGIRCDNHEWVYLSSFTGAPRESLILCDGDILKTSTQCRSRYRYLSEDEL